MLNRCDFIGRIGKDPKVQTISSGAKVARFSVAIENHFKDKSGLKRVHVEWIDVIAWNQMALIAQHFLRKGAKVFVSGRLETTNFIKNGQTRYKTNVIATTLYFLSGRPKKDNPPEEEVDEGPMPNRESEDDEAPF